MECPITARLDETNTLREGEVYVRSHGQVYTGSVKVKSASGEKFKAVLRAVDLPVMPAEGCASSFLVVPASTQPGAAALVPGRGYLVRSMEGKEDKAERKAAKR